MAAINQRIPNFLGGVSQQPDFIKFPGQLRTCHNAFPDVTFGLQKRAPGEYVGKLANAQAAGEWFEILRDGDERYLVQIKSYTNWKANTAYAVGAEVTNDSGKVYVCDQAGTSAGSGGPTGTGANITDNSARWDYNAIKSQWIRVWDLADGTEKTINFTGGAASNYLYLQKAGTTPYGKLTINDYTIITNPEITVATDTRTTAAFKNNYAFVTLNEIAYNSEYVVCLGNSSLSSTTKYRVESLKVVKDGTSSPTWETASPDAAYTGTQTYHGGKDDGAWEDVKFTVVVNAVHFVDSYNGSNPNYNTQYTATVTLQETGLNVGTSWATLDRVVNVNGQNWKVTIEGVSEYQSYTDSNAAVYRTPKNIKKGEITKDTVLGNVRALIEAKYNTNTITANGTGGGTNGTLYGITTTTSGSGTGMTVDLTISSNVVSAITVNNAGSGYANNDTITIRDDQAGTTANVTATINNYVDATVAGNGLYIETNYAFGTIGVRGGLSGDSLEAFTDTAQNISKLPGTCRDGYIVKVSNTEDAEADDYYVKFITDTTDGVGAGVWEETVAPSILAGFNYTTMPHSLINNRDGTFTWTPLSWADTNNNGENDYTAVGDNYWVDRMAGDDNTNPMPTFVGKKISSLFFVRNRFGVLAGEQVVISQPSDYFNFFINSAISASDADPIDIGASDVKPAILNYAIPMQKGVVLFSEAAQFMLFTQSENFSPKTAQLKKLSSYESTADFSPVDIGTAIMFASNASSYSKVFELLIVDDNQPPKVIEQTRVVPEYIPRDINRITNSAQAGVVTFGKIGSSDLYHYKYFDSGQQREQSAWYSWSLQGTLVHQLYSAGNFYSVTLQGSEYVLQRFELVVNADVNRAYSIGTGTVGAPTNIARRFESCLDNMAVYKQNDATVTTPGLSVALSGLNSVVTLPYTIQGGADKIQLVELADGNVRVPNSVSGNTATFNKVDLRAIQFSVGYKYTTEIQLPTYYLSKDRGQYDVEADLRIHRLNFDLGVSGPMEFHIQSPQRDSYIHEESGILLDINALNKVPSELYKNISVPVYKKNHKYDITVKIPDPFTATLVSASWDGSYNTKRHARQ